MGKAAICVGGVATGCWADDIVRNWSESHVNENDKTPGVCQTTHLSSLSTLSCSCSSSSLSTPKHGDLAVATVFKLSSFSVFSLSDEEYEKGRTTRTRTRTRTRTKTRQDRHDSGYDYVAQIPDSHLYERLAFDFVFHLHRLCFLLMPCRFLKYLPAWMSTVYLKWHFQDLFIPSRKLNG